ncbi:MAG TPA: Smr/MutS family protein [Thermodesulfobacteriota bacterium]|nr:Smr/MutS family protein [Deltaproteobacteria bacterium]HOC39269.1 Smr/MutS family protein [Thermodesulfobacteriota bacterium]
MRSTKPSVTLKSFKDLKSVQGTWTSRSEQTPLHDTTIPPVMSEPEAHDDAEDLFLEAMADVQRLTPDEHEKCLEKIAPGGRNRCPAKDAESDGMEELARLLDSGEGFVVANTPEYIEGTGYNVSPSVARRLHEGHYAIEAFIDLHGYTVDTAWGACDAFIREALKTGKRAVLIVHGRGLSSPGVPVLKTKIEEWLTRGPWRKWVIAFSSAQSYDGGLGATYVLLRRQPLTKRLRKNRENTKK